MWYNRFSASGSAKNLPDSGSVFANLNQSPPKCHGSVPNEVADAISPAGQGVAGRWGLIESTRKTRAVTDLEAVFNRFRKRGARPFFGESFQKGRDSEE
ncbi:MAG: hypothetical protein D6679_09225 [Candidatus Hydrogenedentota bacterium]|nr:MAG: hypothetical protein D6679_09225 [Candidatus Hydrogenedentota bacterium]